MTEVEELVVAMRGEGLDETTGQLESAEESMGDSADEMGDSADEMEGFASRWQGAMTAIVTGLAVASAGLLAQVPVVGELMQGLLSVIEAIAFQMDQVLRPVLEPLTDGFFKLSDAIFNADGIIGDIIGVLGTLVAIAGLALGVLAFTGIGPSATAALGAVAAGAKAAAIAIAGVISSISLLAAAIIAIIALIVLLVAAFATDFMGIRSGTVNALEGAADAIGSFTNTVVSEFKSLIGQASGWGADLMTEFADGIVSALDAPVQAAQEALSGVTDLISFDMRENDQMAQRWGEDLLTEFSVGMERGIKTQLPQTAIEADEGNGPPASGGRKTTVVLDGRRVDKGTRRFSDSETAPRGRHS